MFCCSSRDAAAQCNGVSLRRGWGRGAIVRFSPRWVALRNPITSQMILRPRLRTLLRGARPRRPRWQQARLQSVLSPVAASPSALSGKEVLMMTCADGFAADDGNLLSRTGHSAGGHGAGLCRHVSRGTADARARGRDPQVAPLKDYPRGPSCTQQLLSGS